MTDLNTILKNQFSFDDILIDDLYKRLIHKTYKKGEHFLEIGTKPRNFGFMEYGCFMYYQMKDGVETAIDFTFENSWNTDLASINENSKSEMGIVALKDCSLLNLSLSGMEELISMNPNFLRVKSYYVEKTFASVSRHDRRMLTMSATERYKDLVRLNPEILAQVPQYYIASYLGIKPPSLSRIRKEINQ